jgi:hypothetical protein
MPSHSRTRIASAIGQHVSEGEGREREGKCGSKNEVSCFAQRRSLRPGNLQHWNEYDHANWQVQKGRMKAAEKLQPICMCVAVQTKQERQCQKHQ